MRIVFLALAVFAFLGVDGRARAGAPTRPASAAAVQAAKPEPSKNTSVSDARLEQDIRARLSKSKINTDHFTVTVRNGVATLEGKTSVIQHKGAATRVARTAGAVAVRNNIQISAEARARAAARFTKPSSGPVRATVVPSTPH